MTRERIESGCSVDLSKKQVQDILHRADGSTRTELDVLTACGQATLCYNLMRHLVLRRESGEQSPRHMSSCDALIGKARADWTLLQEQPFAMVDERLTTGRSAGRQAQIQRILERASEL